jgi:multidrug efflux pump subunit AcrB
MADLNDQLVDEDGASDQPAAPSTSPSLEEIVKAAVAELAPHLDKRFEGFQSLVDKKFGKLASEFQTARLSPEEQEQLAAESEDEEIEAMRRELELLRMKDQFPRGVARLMALSQSTSLEDQLALMEALEDPQAAAQEAQAQAEAEGDPTPVPEVDRNNPQRPLKAGLEAALAQGEMTDDIADAILGAAG